MFRLDADLKVYLHREAIDFRKGINGLATLVGQSMGQDSFARAAYAFRNRGGNRIKLLIYDRTGFWLLIKRLEQDRFAWPRRPQAVMELTAQPLPGCGADAATIATVMTGKYADGMPLYRMEAVLGRVGIALSRGTMGHWMIGASQRHLQRLHEAMHAVLLAQPLIHGDETRVQVLHEEGKRAQSQSYMWVYRSAESSTTPVVLFEYQPGRGQQYPQAFLQSYAGTLMTDGYSVWRTLTQVEALARGDLPAGHTRADYTHRLRQQHSVPVLSVLRTWLDQQAAQVLPKSLLGEAITYARNQWSYLSRYTDDGNAPIDNNAVERDIRPFTTGRKNWLFSDTVAGAQSSAVIYSLMLTCRACGVEPYAHLCHVLTELPLRAEGQTCTTCCRLTTPAASRHNSTTVHVARCGEIRAYSLTAVVVDAR
ncbi:MAG: IS66 family insertion sequence element accessory protein TnpB [Burkholderiales bacterium]|nr:IS66 family insertion sequence element accessory protein TnpB [Burkholderiales bacterium]